MAQLTAVEWLEYLYREGILIEKSFDMAKDMEKEQIVDAYRNGANDEFEHWMNNEDRITSVGYYKRTYNK
jgi:hypothetical protein